MYPKLIIGLAISFLAGLSYAQNVGIGTTTPAFPLTVRAADLGIMQESDDGTVKIGFYTSSLSFGDAYVQTYSNHDLKFATNNEVADMVLQRGTGFLGLRTMTPYHPLTFKSELGDKISFFGGTGSGTVGHYGIGIANFAFQIYSASSNDDIVFGHGRSGAFVENVRMKGNGNVGIGSSAPNAAGLVVDKKVGAVNAMFGSNTTGVAIESNFPGVGFNTYFNGGRKFIANGFGGLVVLNPSNGDFYIFTSDAAGIANNVANIVPRLFINSAGNVGIGTITPTVRLQVGNSGDGSVARANAWQTFSDERYKKDIVPIANALEKIEQLNGYYYYWKEGADANRQAGLLAQEVEKVIPEIVNTDSQGYKSVDYGKMNALLLQALKEQNNKVELLEKQVEQLIKLIQKN